MAGVNRAELPPQVTLFETDADQMYPVAARQNSRCPAVMTGVAQPSTPAIG